MTGRSSYHHDSVKSMNRPDGKNVKSDDKNRRRAVKKPGEMPFFEGQSRTWPTSRSSVKKYRGGS
jgi:hypothetical protein